MGLFIIFIVSPQLLDVKAADLSIRQTPPPDSPAVALRVLEAV